MAGDCVDPLVTEHMCNKSLPAEKRGERGVKHIQHPGIGAESRHHEPVAVGREAAPPHRPATLDDHCARMKMPCDLPCPRALQRLVTEGQAPYSDLVSDNAGQVGGSVRIM